MRLAMIISNIPEELPEQANSKHPVLDGHFPMQNSVARNAIK